LLAKSPGGGGGWLGRSRLPFLVKLLRRTIFPYEFHFAAVNTHVFISDPLPAMLTLTAA
jgi:hypothetical protein